MLETIIATAIGSCIGFTVCYFVWYRKLYNACKWQESCNDTTRDYAIALRNIVSILENKVNGLETRVNDLSKELSKPEVLSNAKLRALEDWMEADVAKREQEYGQQ